MITEPFIIVTWCWNQPLASVRTDMLKIETGLFCLQPAPVLREWICGSKTLPEVEPKPEIDEGDYLMEQEGGTPLSPKQFHIFGYILEREKPPGHLWVLYQEHWSPSSWGTSPLRQPIRLCTIFWNRWSWVVRELGGLPAFVCRIAQSRRLQRSSLQDIVSFCTKWYMERNVHLCCQLSSEMNTCMDPKVDVHQSRGKVGKEVCTGASFSSFACFSSFSLSCSFLLLCILHLLNTWHQAWHLQALLYLFPPLIVTNLPLSNLDCILLG